jgi:diguanylate cyclase (GGDEF)-like protein
MTERKKLWILANKDHLTGLYIRRFFNERLQTELKRCRAEGRRISVLLANVDNLKEINDSYGRQAGDALLQQVARAIKETFNKNSFLARFEDGSFAILLPVETKQEAQAAAERLQQKVVSRNFKINGDTHRVTVSIGAVISDDETAAELAQRVDDALFEAKEEGSNKICFR